MKKQKSTDKNFLIDLLNAKSPSGHEYESQAVLEKYVKPHADIYEKDSMGNRFATVNPHGNPSIMFSGHMDEIALMVRYVDDQGYIYLDSIGGHDLSIISGRRVIILNDKKPVYGITGKRAIHLISLEDRKKTPELHQIWIDIGSKNKQDTLKKINIGDPVIYDEYYHDLDNSTFAARGIDNKGGCYVIMEAFRRLCEPKAKKKLHAKVVSVATVQEEVGVRGAVTSAYSVNPKIGIAVDVSHSTDSPDYDKRKLGEFKLGSGPIITRGPNINPIVYQKLIHCAQKHNIPYQIEAEGKPTGTDARALQISRQGIATGLVSIPLRYMHTPSEVAHLQDIEHCVQLLVAFSLSISPHDSFDW